MRIQTIRKQDSKQLFEWEWGMEQAFFKYNQQVKYMRTS